MNDIHQPAPPLVNESQLQYFIAEHPWLLDLNYERVPELQGNDIEFQAGDMKRIDLILRDRISGRPVIVEFKFTPFYRDNIGQILEYRARVAGMLNTQQQLAAIFGNHLLAPKLILVVKQCDDFSKYACNMSGIDVYEYEGVIKEFAQPSKVAELSSVRKILENEILPWGPNRPNDIQQKVYNPIKSVFEELNIDSDNIEPRNSDAYAFYGYGNMFINRWYLRSEPTVSITLYEEIFKESFPIAIGYFSHSNERLEEFKEIYERSFPDRLELDWCPKINEGFLVRRFDRKDFLENVADRFKTELERHRTVKEQMQPVSQGV